MRIMVAFTRLSALLKSSAWADVVKKAQRLLRSGAVTIYNNTSEHISGHVIGDHGDYNTSVDRMAEANGTRLYWKCECKWGQWAWKRTRKWQQRNARPCSHVIALEWRAMGTPYDDGSHDPEAPKKPFQRYKPLNEDETAERNKQNEQMRQDRGIAPREQQQADELANLPRSFQPTDQPQVSDPEQQAAPEAPQAPENPFQRQHLELPDVGHPELGQPAQQPTVTDPSGPTEEDPTKLPGAFSSVPVFVVRSSTFHFAELEDENELANLIQTGRAVVRLNRPAWLEQRGGKIPLPRAQPREMNAEGVEVYNTLDLGYHPDRQRRVNADEDPNGAPERRGQYSEIAAGRRAEAVDYEPLLKQVMIRVPMNLSGPLHPHYAEGWVDAADVSVIPAATRGPFDRHW